MRKIIVATYMTMDGVLQAPGGHEEDRSNGFKWGGWSFPYWDELMVHTWIFPITLGKGKKLFEEGTPAQEWKLTESVVSTTGVVIASYVPNGEVKLGSFVPDEVSEAELARREKWSRE